MKKKNSRSLSEFIDNIDRQCLMHHGLLVTHHFAYCTTPATALVNTASI